MIGLFVRYDVASVELLMLDDMLVEKQGTHYRHRQQLSLQFHSDSKLLSKMKYKYGYHFHTILIFQSHIHLRR